MDKQRKRRRSASGQEWPRCVMWLRNSRGDRLLGSAGHARSGTRTDVVAWRPTDTGSSDTWGRTAQEAWRT